VWRRVIDVSDSHWRSISQDLFADDGDVETAVSCESFRPFAGKAGVARLDEGDAILRENIATALIA
jgi:hypothetical protein